MGQGRQATEIGTAQRERAAESDAARKRAAVEMIAGHESSLKRTARRYSIDAEDAEDAYQRALEIVLTKAPTTDPRELIRWTQTVTKHEALAVRQGREKLLGRRGGGADEGASDPVALIPALGDSPAEQVERREAVARSREALQALKPAELRALSLLAEGYSYAEIGSITGFSPTKINRVLAEGRERFRSLVSSSEDGSRCRELLPLLSAHCDGESSPAAATTVREHLRACGRCRATMRAYRAAPGIAAALAPALPSRSLLERTQEFLAGLGSRLPGGGSDATATQIAAAGGSRGAGIAALAKLLAVCAGAAGTAACVATGVLPTPLDLAPEQRRKPAIERAARGPIESAASDAVQYEPAEPAPAPKPKPEPKATPKEKVQETSSEASEAPVGAIEYEPPPPAAPVASGESASPSASSGSAAGEFGP
jgi:RNA polymerase sigma factor (sigma-70 family)